MVDVASTATDEQAQLRSVTERWFTWHGVPHFIDDYNAKTDILTRMARFLTVVFVIEPFLPGTTHIQPPVRILGVGLTILVVLGGFVLYNRLRGRPAFAPPRQVGLWAVAAFLILPPLELIVLSRSWDDAIQLLIMNCLIFGVSFLITSYAVIPTGWWAARQFIAELPQVAPLAARTVPLLLIITLLAFFNQEVWLIAATVPGGLMAAALLILVGLGFALMLITTPRDLDPDIELPDWNAIDAATIGTPVANLSVENLPDPPPDPALTRSAQRNLRAIRLIAASVQVSLVTIVIVALFIVFGMLLVNPRMIEDLTSQQLSGTIWTWDSPLGQIVLSRQLIVAALFVGVISGLQFTVTALTDPSYREQFRPGGDRHVQTAIAVLQKYRARLLTE